MAAGYGRLVVAWVPLSCQVDLEAGRTTATRHRSVCTVGPTAFHELPGGRYDARGDPAAEETVLWDGGVRHVASVESGPETDPVLADLELSRSLTIQWALVLLSFGGLFVLDEIVTDRALTSLEDRDVTVTRAATMAGCSVWDVANLALKRDVDWVGAEHLLSDLDIVD